MRIFDLDRETREDEVRVAATFRFERADLPEARIFVAGRGAAAEALQPAPDGFLLMGLPLACWVGEPRVEVEGSVCSLLRENLANAMRLYEGWLEHAQPLPIEPTAGFVPARPSARRHTAMLLSGGVDSLATLRSNRDACPPDHPDAVCEALFFIGSNTYDRPGGAAAPVAPDRMRAYEARIRRLRAFAADLGLALTVLETNARQLYPSWPIYRDLGWAASMLAPVHQLATRITDVLISSTGYGTDIPFHGSHPLLDPLYSSGALRVRHTLPFTERFEKLAMLADWPEGLAVLDVCLGFDATADGPANCGRCAKCQRTMLGLLALGRLADASLFATRELTVEDVAKRPIPNEYEANYREGMVEALERAGHGDIARALRRNLRRWRRRRRPHHRVMRELRRAFRRRAEA